MPKKLCELFALRWGIIFLLCQCSQFKYNPNTNCLDSNASCFKADKTAPTINSSVPLSGATIQQVADIQSITFSEPVNNADKAANYKFSGTGGANLSVSGVTKIDDKTYQLILSGGLQNGPVTLTIANVTDWAGNPLATPTLTFTGSVNLAVTITPSGLPGAKYYVSNTFGTLNLNFTWQSDSVAEQYFVNIVPAASACPAAPTSSNSTGIGNTGVVATANTNITTQIKASDMAGVGDYSICIFVNKTSIPLKSGNGSVVFTRDDTRPVFSVITPAASSSINNTNTAYTLSEDCASGTIQRSRTGGSLDPGAPYTQTLSVATDLTTGLHSGVTNNPALVSGTIYSYAFNCTDYAGNPATTVTQTNVTYDTTAPVFSAVAPATGAFVNTTRVSYTLSKAITSGTVTWTYVSGPADTNHVQTLTGAELNTGAHTNITLTNNPVLVSGAVYNISFDGTDAAGNVASTVTVTGITYDSTPPSAPIAGLYGVTVISTSQIDMGGSANDNVGTVSYDVCQTTTAGGCTTFSATVTGVTLPVAMSGLTANTTYYYSLRGRDQAGNVGAQSAEVAGTTKNTTPGRVYGQLGSLTNTLANNGGITANSLNTPQGVAVDATGVYIADTSNNRVLYYAGTSTTATRVYGHTALTCGLANENGSCGAGLISATNLAGPTGVAVDGTGVYIADLQNSRVLWYSGTSTTATRVYGQAGSFATGTANTGGLSANSLQFPQTVTVDGTGVYIADLQNCRVLWYSGTSTTATRVYGQLGSFTANTQNNGGITANSLWFTYGIAVDGTGVYISEDNNRALWYSGTSTTATRVYGQLGSFTTNANAGLSAVTLNTISQSSITVNGGNVYISDFGNNRVLFYPSTSTTATAVYGQGGIFSANASNQGGAATGLNGPTAVAVDASSGVYIVDKGNNRVLYYP